MYCQTCGNQLTPGLSYCPRCGAGQSLVRSASLPPPPTISPDSLIWAVVVSTVVVLSLILGGIIALKNSGLGDELVWTFVMVCLLALVGVDAMLLRLLQGLRKEARGVIQDEHLREVAPRQVREAGVGALGEPAASVTEQTTREFEHVYVGRKGE